MLPSSDDLIRRVEESRGSKTRELASELGVTEEDYGDFIALALRLQIDGSIIRVPEGGWDIPERTQYRVGSLALSRKGQGFVRVAPGSIKEEDFFIAGEDMEEAFDRDIVLIRIARGPARGKREGLLRQAKVVDVLRRSRRIIRGKFSLGKQGGFVTPSDPRAPSRIAISTSETRKSKDGEKVLVRLLDGAARGGSPRGKVVARVAEEGTFETDFELIRETFDLPGEHPADAVAEALAAPPMRDGAAWPDRMDLRDLPVFTIDPVDAKDFDDAISLETIAGGHRVGVHIADVSHYVKPGSALDREAEARGTSIYLPGRVIPMLPERLSNDLCSLRPGEDRLAKTVRMTFGPRWDLKKVEVFRSVIRSRRRFTYEEVLAILVLLETGEASASLPPDHVEHEETLGHLAVLRDKLHAERRERGALYLDIPKLRLHLDESGNVSGLGRDERDPSHALIEELMLAANEAVASYFQEKQLPLVARVHPPPERKKLDDYRRFLQVLGHRMGGKGGSRDLQKLIDKIAGDPLSPVIQLGLLRTMGHAEYVVGAGLHFALATASYCHFTSPIRRYPDLIVHQALEEHLTGSLRPGRRREWDGRLPHAAEQASELERRAEEAEREMTKLRLIRFLEPMVGESMDGRIVSVHPFGFFVRIEETLVEGLVHVTTLDDDYYDFDEEKLTLAGRRSKRAFRLEDRVRVELTEVDADLREITFNFVRRIEGA